MTINQFRGQGGIGGNQVVKDHCLACERIRRSSPTYSAIAGYSSRSAFEILLQWGHSQRKRTRRTKGATVSADRPAHSGELFANN